VWVYYSALIVFFGAEFTQAWATRHGPVGIVKLTVRTAKQAG
jgi:uncharacterized BrkB/YihY/UPF0761 family membrane protein